MAATPGKNGRRKTYQADQLLAHLPAANVKEWQQRVAEEAGMSRALFYQFKAELESRGAFLKAANGTLQKP